MGLAHDAALGWLDEHGGQLVRWRRDLHAHPEIGFAEHRTTELIVATLTELGLSPRKLATGTGVVCDIGGRPGSGMVALRADIDALPLTEETGAAYASRNPGVCHACGHDAHTAILLGVAASLAGSSGVAGRAGQRVRLLFQPAEERTPGGAEAAIADGVLDGVGQIFALHCDPRLDAGRIGIRPGPITASFNRLELRIAGPGGHTARPQLSADVVYAIGKLITELPGLLSRRVDPRAALSLVWGAVSAGSAPNAIPTTGVLRGTLRMLNSSLWSELHDTVRELAEQVVAPTEAHVEVDYDRGVPAVVNDAAMAAVQSRAAAAAFGADAVADTAQSMGGEDFAWYLRQAPGAMARLGVRRPGLPGGDLHQATFDIDESALAVGVRFTAAILDELEELSARDREQPTGGGQR